MGQAYLTDVAPLTARVVADLLTGSTDAAQELRDVIDAKIKVGGLTGEAVSDVALAQFPMLWGVLCSATSSKLTDVEIEAETP